MTAPIYILDVSALSVWVNDEPGSYIVDGYVDDAAISAVSIAVLAERIAPNVDETQLEQALDFGVDVIPLTHQIATLVATISRSTPRSDLSFENLVVLASARAHSRTVVTADRNVASCGANGVEILHVSDI